MRGILKSGGSIEVEWPLARALQVADQAVGVPVLEELYDHMKATPVSPDLPQIWKELGVDRRAGTVVFNDSATLAPIRMAITSLASRNQESEVRSHCKSEVAGVQETGYPGRIKYRRPIDR